MPVLRIMVIAAIAVLSFAAQGIAQQAREPLPTLDEARDLPDTAKLELASYTLLGDVRTPDYGFPLLVDMARQGDRPAIQLLAKAIVSNNYSFGDDVDVVLRALGNEAMQSSSSAIMARAVIYDRGIDVPEDDLLAYEWYRWAAIIGSESGTRETAISLASGKGVERDVVEALQWADRLPPARRSSTYLAVAELLYASDSAEDQALAEKLSLDSAQLEPANAMRAAMLLLEYSSDPAALARASDMIAGAALAGDARALIVQAGIDEQSNDPALRASATETYIELSKAGSPEATKRLARLMAGGSLSTQKLDEVMKIVIEQADAGNIEAITAISRAYMFGSGVPVSFDKAADYFQKGADLGNAEAQYQLGLMYASGIGVAQDGMLAKAWLEKSAAGGNQVAAATLETTR